MDFKHIPVLLNECIKGLNIKPDGIYVDGTLGGAGHSYEILQQLSKKGLLIGIDRDEEALNAAKEKLKKFDNIQYVHGNHDDIKQILYNLSIEKVDGILLDLGVSSYQLDEPARGFSYMKESPLDMRMDKNATLTAEKILNTYSEKELSKIIFEYGEERFANRIAKKICEYRKESPIRTTAELTNIIENAIPKALQKEGHPAKKTFQAIRIEVNDELNVFEKALKDALDLIKVGGRICVITFHSLEDRICKQIFKEVSTLPKELKNLPIIPDEYKPKYKIIGSITPKEKELNNNNRARSAKLRIIERVR